MTVGDVVPWKELISPHLNPFSLVIGISTWEIQVVQGCTPSVPQGESKKGLPSQSPVGPTISMAPGSLLDGQGLWPGPA